MRRGDVFYFTFPQPIGRRPCVLVSRDSGHTVVIVVYITNTEPSRRYPTVVPVAELPSINGATTGFVRCDHPITLARTSLDAASAFAHIDAEDIRRINDALRVALDL